MKLAGLRFERNCMNAPARAAKPSLILAPPWRAMALRSLICALLAASAWWVHRRHEPAGTALYMLAYTFGSWDLAREAWGDLLRLRFDTHFLMLLVVPGSVAVGALGEGALLLVLFSASTAMETFAQARTEREISALLHGAPKTARLLTADGSEYPVTVEALKPGLNLRLLAGEQAPVDFLVTRGSSACDEAMLTGEAEPVAKAPGATVLAGTVNTWGVLEGRVLRVAAESQLQKIIRLITEAQHLKAPVQRFTDHFGTGYTTFVLLACLVMFFISWQVFGAAPFFSTDVARSAFYRSMTLLTVLSPCALVLSVPSAILSAIAYGARHGVLFRGGAAIENLAEIQIVAMDKTGTLTEGALQVVGTDVFQGTEQHALILAGSLAALSTHPISRALTQAAQLQAGFVPHLVTDSTTVPGQGLRAHVDGQRVQLGNRELLGNRVPADVAAPTVGTNETWLATETVLVRFLLRDRLRSTARDLVARLAARGLRTVMLTGDRATAAAELALEAGVSDVRAGLKPEQKVAAIQELKAAGTKVAMIGDGVNDAPCLAAADVGVAMGARGSDAALEQAEVVLMHDRLENFLLAFDLSTRARRVIRQNLFLSLGVMVGMGLCTLFWTRLPLSLGVAAHEGSTAVVVLNSLRLIWNRPKR